MKLGKQKINQDLKKNTIRIGKTKNQNLKQNYYQRNLSFIRKKIKQSEIEITMEVEDTRKENENQAKA